MQALAEVQDLRAALDAETHRSKLLQSSEDIPVVATRRRVLERLRLHTSCAEPFRRLPLQHQYTFRVHPLEPFVQITGQGAVTSVPGRLRRVGCDRQTLVEKTSDALP